MTEAELNDLIGEREDAKRQRDIIVQDNIRINRELKARPNIQRRAELNEQRGENAKALTRLDRRLAELKQLIHQNTPMTFASAFYKAAKELLGNETFETIRLRAQQYQTATA